MDDQQVRKATIGIIVSGFNHCGRNCPFIGSHGLIGEYYTPARFCNLFRNWARIDEKKEPDRIQFTRCPQCIEDSKTE